MKAPEAGEAHFSPDETYRYTLTRVWDKELPRALWIGLNPSTADARRLDPTMRRIARFSMDWGYGGFDMGNLFAFRATDPLVMKAHGDPVGPDNDRWLWHMADRCQLVVCAWGAHGDHRGRDAEVRTLLRSASAATHAEVGDAIRVVCLGTTLNGQPKHPVRLARTTKPIPYELGSVVA